MTRYACLEDARIRIKELRVNLSSYMLNNYDEKVLNIIDDIDNDIRQAMEEWE